MKISAVIPVHNRASLLNKAVGSVLEQTYPVEEVIVVDDGSSDDPRSELKNFPDKRIKFVQQPNEGVSAARNRGIRESRHEWVALLDSDDYWLSKKIEKQVLLHRENPELLVSQTDEIWVRNGKRVNPKKYHFKKDGNIFESSLSLCLISPSAVLIHKNIFNDAGLFDVRLPACEDYDLWLRITRKYPVGLVPEKLVVKTGGHSDQLSKKFWGMDRFRVAALEKLVSSYSLTDGQTKAAVRKIIEKLAILSDGAKKRGKTREAEEYANKLETYKKCLADIRKGNEEHGI